MTNPLKITNMDAYGNPRDQTIFRGQEPVRSHADIALHGKSREESCKLYRNGIGVPYPGTNIKALIHKLETVIADLNMFDQKKRYTFEFKIQEVE